MADDKSSSYIKAKCLQEAELLKMKPLHIPG